jgi:hypothetical protein
MTVVAPERRCAATVEINTAAPTLRYPPTEHSEQFALGIALHVSKSIYESSRPIYSLFEG